MFYSELIYFYFYNITHLYTIMVHLFYPVSVSPLTFYTALFIIGIVCEHLLAYCFFIFSITALWALLLYCVSLNTRIVYVIYACCATTGGLFLARYQSSWHHIAHKVIHEEIDLEGIITNRTPSLNSKHMFQYTIYVTKSSNPLLRNTYLALYLKSSKKLFSPGKIISLQKARFHLAPDHFAAYLMKEGFSATVYSSLENIKEHPLADSWWAVLYTIRFRLLDWSESIFSQSTHALFSSLFLGYKWSEPIEKNRETFSHFKFWGISHYIARSGLHLAILIFLWQCMLSYIPLPWRTKQWILIMGSLLYLLSTWSSTSFMRALANFIISRLFAYGKESVHFIHTLSLTALLMLMSNPTLLFFLDFQLSFGMTLALAWINNIDIQKKSLQNKPLFI